MMANRQRRLERAAWLVHRDLLEVGDNLRTARLAAGLTLAEVARALGVSPQTVLRDERPPFPPGPNPDLLARHAAAVGMRARVKVYPEGEPIRDAAQVELTGKFRTRLKTPHRIAFEVPVTDAPSDGHAWDAVLELPGCTCALEFVTRFHDCQAQLRAFSLKFRDGRVDRLIVIVKATPANRRALNAARDVLEANFPLGTRRVMADLAAGRAPSSNGVILL